MRIYRTQQEVEKDIKDGVLVIEGDVKFECSISIEASIMIVCGNITAWNINARDINAWNITAWDINAWDINARDINAWDINARDITAGNITAWDINARDITAWDILYYAFCCVYKSIKCLSIKAKRNIYKEPICLEGRVEIIDEKPKSLVGKIVEVKLDDKAYRAKIIE